MTATEKALIDEALGMSAQALSQFARWTSHGGDELQPLYLAIRKMWDERTTPEARDRLRLAMLRRLEADREESEAGKLFTHEQVMEIYEQAFPEAPK